MSSASLLLGVCNSLYRLVSFVDFPGEFFGGFLGHHLVTFCGGQDALASLRVFHLIGVGPTFLGTAQPEKDDIHLDRHRPMAPGWLGEWNWQEDSLVVGPARTELFIVTPGRRSGQYQRKGYPRICCYPGHHRAARPNPPLIRSEAVGRTLLGDTAHAEVWVRKGRRG